MAEALGFDRTSIAELAVVVSELVSNVLKYGVRGTLELQVVTREPHGLGIEIVARDEGPPISDFALALLDGHTDLGPIAPESLRARRGLGAGLGAVLRLTDELRHQPEAQAKSIIALRFRTRPKRARSP